MHCKRGGVHGRCLFVPHPVPRHHMSVRTRPANGPATRSGSTATPPCGTGVQACVMASGSVPSWGSNRAGWPHRATHTAGDPERGLVEEA